MTDLHAVMQEAARRGEAGQAFALATVVRAERPTSAKAGAKAIVTPDGALHGWVGGSCAQPTVIREAQQALLDGQPRLLRLCPPEHLGHAPQAGVREVALTCISGGTLEIYIEPYLARPQLIAIGHLPVSEALVTLGKGLGYAVTILGLDASPGRYPLADQVLDRLDFSALRPTPQTYVVVASHGNYDEEALAWALGTNAAYIGLVASRRRAESVLQYLRESGLDEAQLARIKFPAGLDIGAVMPEEIALSILAEIVHLRQHGAHAGHAHHAEHAAAGMAASAAPASPLEAIDPVCGMTVEIATARHTAEHLGVTYYFCCPGCKRTFLKTPEAYLKRAE
jgi:xanthine dehydrogenase accessory factor